MEGEKYNPSTQYNPKWKGEDKRMYFKARATYWQSGTKVAMADEVAKLKEKHDRQRAKDNKE